MGYCIQLRNSHPNPMGKAMQKLNREELITLVQKLIHNEEFGSDEDIDAAIETLKSSVPDPNVTDYIFWPDPIDKEVDPKEVVDRALSYKPRNTPEG